ncbi:MAG TPA: peptidoglycan editing factor PgeF [Ktedonobacterales bacterium]|nr:peptidoglycan editing factor PgeF [Ktedonobacterales bacterium]
MIERQTEHTEYLLFEHLASIPGLVHAVFTRKRGFSAAPFAGLNASFTTGDDAEIVRRNKAAIIETLGLALLGARPVHGNTAIIVERDDLRDETGETTPAVARLQGRLRHTDADAMLSDAPGFAFCWAFGDCSPILLYDPAHHAFALVHAGWRGAAGAVAPQAIQTMRRRWGTRPSDLLVGIGPSIGACCYEVNEQVRERFAANPLAWESARFVEREPEGGGQGTGLYLDIPESNYQQLLAAGVAPEHIEMSEHCTGCRTDLFFSHRREPWPSGRFAVAIGLRGEK